MLDNTERHATESWVLKAITGTCAHNLVTKVGNALAKYKDSKWGNQVNLNQLFEIVGNITMNYYN